MAMNAGTRISRGVRRPPLPVNTASERIASSSPCCSSGGTVRGSVVRVRPLVVFGVVSGGGVVTGGGAVAVGVVSGAVRCPRRRRRTP